MIRRVLLALLSVVAALGAWIAWPPRVPEPRVAPAASYAEAVRRLGVLESADSLALHAGCASEALLHGSRAPRAVVMLHGLTNCPLQFHALATRMYEGGDNVIVPRVPHHGLANRMTTDLAALTSGELTALAAECVGIARGLGDTVVVVGLSTSGVLAAWSAQRLEGVDRGVIIAPAYSPLRPGLFAWMVGRLAMRAPNQFVWWKPEQKEALDGPTQCYPRFSTRAVGAVYAIGERVWADAGREPPQAADLAVVTTACDEAVSLPRAHALAARWRAHGRRVREMEFPRADRVLHDMVDPGQVGARVDHVYPVLVALVHGEALPPGAVMAASVPAR